MLLRSGSRAARLIIRPSPFLLDERVFVSRGILLIASVSKAMGIRCI
jgi:hypothetical protein